MSQSTHTSQLDAAELAVHLGQPSLSAADWAQVEQTIPMVSVEELCTVAQRLGVGPLVAAQLADRAGLPESVSQYATARRREAATQNLFLAGELARVLSTFEAAEIRAIPYKGPVLAARAYDDIAHRSFADLDLFVARDDVPAACDALEARGFERKQDQYTPEEIAQNTSVLRLPQEFTFVNDGVVVEIRWQLGSEIRPFEISFERCWERRTELTVAGQTMPAFSVEDCLLVLARHGAKHHWNRLGWIIDVAALIERVPINWETLLNRAERLCVRRVLQSGLLLAAEIADAPVPSEILTTARADTHVRQIVDQTVAQFVTQPETAAYSRDRMRVHAVDIRLCDSWTERLQFLARMIGQPEEIDYESVPLPRALHGLYYGIRPARLLLTAGKKARSGGTS